MIVDTELLKKNLDLVLENNSTVKTVLDTVTQSKTEFPDWVKELYCEIPDKAVIKDGDVCVTGSHDGFECSGEYRGQHCKDHDSPHFRKLGDVLLDIVKGTL